MSWVLLLDKLLTNKILVDLIIYESSENMALTLTVQKEAMQ